MEKVFEVTIESDESSWQLVNSRTLYGPISQQFSLAGIKNVWVVEKEGEKNENSQH